MNDIWFLEEIFILKSDYLEGAFCPFMVVL